MAKISPSAQDNFFESSISQGNATLSSNSIILGPNHNFFMTILYTKTLKISYFDSRNIIDFLDHLLGY